MPLSSTEENYLKAIFKLSKFREENISTNNIAAEMQTAPASVTDMVRKLGDKKLVHYEKYKGVQLTEEGRKLAIHLIRSHRLWEVFLVEKLGFNWDEVHEIAEELEHIKSDELIRRLDDFLGLPTHDPHGDPIPDAEGNIAFHEPVSANQLQPGEKGLVVGVIEQSPDFLQYLDRIKLNIRSKIIVKELNEFDSSRLITIEGGGEQFISEKVASNLVVKKL